MQKEKQVNLLGITKSQKRYKEIDKIFIDYIVNIIPKDMDTAIKEQGRQ